jgi:hypothetical protein
MEEGRGKREAFGCTEMRWKMEDGRGKKRRKTQKTI